MVNTQINPKAVNMALALLNHPEVEAPIDPDAVLRVAAKLDDLMDSIELAWILISNAHCGDINATPAQWKDNAINWRDDHWHRHLRDFGPK